MQPDKISIIIACYNDYEYIEKAVQSALDQTYENKEIIVVDDGSNGQTKAVLKKLNPKLDLIITQDNSGVSAARNTGIKRATGKFILILDSDDYFEPEFCEKAIRIFHKKNHVKIITCYSNWFDSKSGSKLFKPGGGELKEALINSVAMGSAMFRKMDWIETCGYDENMFKGYEDWEFYIRLLKDGGSTYVIPEVLFNYRNKPNSKNKTANLIKYELLEYIYLKHANLYKKHFPLFIQEWLGSVKKSEAFKQQVMDSLDYKIGFQLLRPLRYFGFFKK